MLLIVPENPSYFGGLMLVLTAGYFFIGLRFIMASIGGLSLLILYSIGAVFLSSIDKETIIANDFFFAAANLIGMFAAYIIEFYKRKNFFLNKQLDKQNAEIILTNKNLEEIVTSRTNELIIAKDKAEESDQLKSAFLANMSHEIRTPLNSIIGFSELLNDSYFEEEQKKEFIQTIINSGKSLMMIINDIMDLSMLESKQLKIRKENIEVNKIFSELNDEFQITANSKNIELTIIKHADNDNLILYSDYYRLKQILTNLINNAFKFTFEGFVEVGYKLVENKIEFYVKDSGIGISPKIHNYIFERFRQAELAKTRKYEGNGLGLAISKNLVEILGGQIWLESDLGKGSTFYFTIPYLKSRV